MSVIVDSNKQSRISKPQSAEEKTSIFLPVDEQGMPRVPWKALAIIATAVLGFAIWYRWYLQTYGFDYGLDYFEPEFQTYWMRLFYIQMIGIPLMAVVAVPYLWFTRPKDPHAAMTPEKELGIYYMIFGALAITSLVLLIALALVVEGDAAWHQTTIRDTDFTPTHIQLFYLMIPAIITGIPIAMVWLHTRMPDFIGRISVPLFTVIAGAILIMPNVGFNEWGHTFFYAEELFGAPIHWGFVILGWGFFGLAGFILQCLNRVRVLTTVVDGQARRDTEAKIAV